VHNIVRIEKLVAHYYSFHDRNCLIFVHALSILCILSQISILYILSILPILSNLSYLSTLPLPDEALQISLIALLQNHINIILGLIDLVHLDQIGMVQLLHSLDFTENQLGVQLGLHELFVDDLDGDRFQGLVVTPLVDRRIGTFPQELRERVSVVADVFFHCDGFLF
jgi:hypothetical protein